MGISRRTAIIIRDADEKDLQICVGDAPEENGKWASALWVTVYSPSGCERPELLISTQGAFDTPEEAKSHMAAIVAEVKAMTDEQIWGRNRQGQGFRNNDTQGMSLLLLQYPVQPPNQRKWLWRSIG